MNEMSKPVFFGEKTIKKYFKMLPNDRQPTQNMFCTLYWELIAPLVDL